MLLVGINNPPAVHVWELSGAQEVENGERCNELDVPWRSLAQATPEASSMPHFILLALGTLSPLKSLLQITEAWSMPRSSRVSVVRLTRPALNTS